MIGDIRRELNELRVPVVDADTAARRDAEAGVPREIGEARHIATACGAIPPDFDPAGNAEHQHMAARLAELRPEIAERKQIVAEIEKEVAKTGAHPFFWACLIAVATPAEFSGGLQLFQVMGASTGYRICGAIALLFCTFVIATVLRTSHAATEEQDGWARLRGWLKFAVALVVAIVVAAFIVLARVDPVATAGLPAAVRLSRMAIPMIVVLFPSIMVKWAVDQIGLRLPPRRALKAERKALKGAEREEARLVKTVGRMQGAAASWRHRAATESARYQSGYDRTAGGQARQTANPDRPAALGGRRNGQ